MVVRPHPNAQSTMQSSAHTTPIQSPALSADGSEGTALSPDQQPCDPAEALDQLNVELGRLREARSDIALHRAYVARPQIFDDAHKRGFLHTESYVVKAAADRMVAYWEARADLFGEEGMLRPMNKSGVLRDEDAAALDMGVLQLLPQKDLDGRGVILYEPSRQDTTRVNSKESMLRVIWYIMHVAKDDPLIRENGFVLIVYPKECTAEQIDRDVIAKGTAIIGSVMPLPWKGFHICHPCSSYNKYFPLVKMLSPTSIKDNIAVHFGTEEHVLQCMASYSLPADRLPKELGGRVDLDYSKWLSDRKDAEGDDALRVAVPAPIDEVMEDAAKSAKGSGKAKSKSAAADADAAKSSGATAKSKRPGRKGDARMHKAVTVKIDTPETSLVEALQEGGFNFQGLNEKGKPHHEVFDQDGVSLMQRKNQLLRRIRVEKKKKKDEEG